MDENHKVPMEIPTIVITDFDDCMSTTFTKPYEKTTTGTVLENSKSEKFENEKNSPSTTCQRKKCINNNASKSGIKRKKENVISRKRSSSSPSLKTICEEIIHKYSKKTTIKYSSTKEQGKLG